GFRCPGQFPVLYFFQAEDGIRDRNVTGVQTCALPIAPAGICGGGASSTVRIPPRPATSAGTSTSTASTTRRGQVRTRARAAARTPLVRAGAGLLVTAFLRHGVSSWQKRTHPIRPMGRPLHRIDAPNN